MPKMHIKKSIQINAPVDKVYRIISDFNHWRPWSPWLITEPEAKVTVAEDAKYYEWEGDRTGSGNMSILTEKTNESIDYDLMFLKPWKSQAKVRFELQPQEKGTKVTWFMDSSLPFFLFWMKKMTEAMIGMDYQRGLAMLKDYAEDGEVHSKLGFKGYATYPGCTYVGIKSDCTMETVGPQMQEDLGKLFAFLKDRQDMVSGVPFSMYHKWNPAKNQVGYTSGVPVKSAPKDLPAGLFIGTIPATKVYTVTHTGPYEHLGNAWSTLYGMSRSKVFKANKKIHPFETYENEPGKVPNNDLITEVHFPVK